MSTTTPESVAQKLPDVDQDKIAVVKDDAREIAQDVRRHSTQMVNEATQQVHSVSEEVMTQLQEHAGTQTERAATQLRTFSEQARALAEGRTEEAGQLPQLAQEATQRLGAFAQRLETGGIDGAMDDVRTFARRKPGTFLLIAGAAGFLGGRMLRATKDEQTPKVV